MAHREKPSWPWRNERGGTLVLVAVVTVALFGMAALAVDIGMGYTAKAEAQRIADASALAGASAFLEFSAANAVTPAEDRAYDFATRNSIRNVPVVAEEVTVEVVPAEAEVRVWVERQAVGTWFARIIGVDEMTIVAFAAAQATPAGAARCLKPFAVPDMWHDADDDDDGDRVWDEGEEWDLDSHPDDRYLPYEGPSGPADATGYGSEWRGPDRDFGRQISIKAQDPQDEYNPSPGIFLPWRLPPDGDGETCDRGGGGGGPAGASTYRNNICTCNESQIELGAEYDIEPGNMLGPTDQGIGELLSEDPDAWWNPSANDGDGGIQDSEYGADGMNSPRVVKLALFDPSEIEGSGMQQIRFNNFALFFIEEHQNMHAPIVGRFLYFVSGEGSPGTVTGSLVRYLRLVE